MHRLGLIMSLAVIFTFHQLSMAQKIPWSIGGRIGFWQEHIEQQTNRRFVFLPEVSCDMNDRWSVSIAMGYEYSSEHELQSNYSAFIISPSVSYTVMQRGILSLSAIASCGWAIGSQNGFEIGMAPELSIDLTERFSIDARCGFAGYRNNFNKSGTGFGVDLDASEITFGISYLFIK